MIKKFSVENYRGFKDKVVLDFSSTRNYNFNTQYLKDGLLNKVLLLGENGSGKSNLGFALFDIVPTLTNNYINQKSVSPHGYLNLDSGKKYATFEYEFKFDEMTAIYRYSKSGPLFIVKECLIINDELVFRRDHNRIDRGTLDKYTLNPLNLKVVDGPLAILKLIYNTTVQNENTPIGRIMAFVEGMLYFNSDSDGHSFIGLEQNTSVIEEYVIRNNLVGDFQKTYNEMTNKSIGMGVVPGAGLSDRLVEIHEHGPLDFYIGSSSGAKTFLLYYYWMKHFDKVSFLYMDEFDAFYHYELAKKVLKHVASISSFQTVFSTHNTSLIGNNILRPDCYLLLYNGSLKKFPELTDRELREGHNLEKMYRNGEFDE